MIASFAKERAAMGEQVADEVDPFHATGIESGSRITSWPRIDSSANSRFASSTSATASLRFSLASFSVSP
jgi:hypothetical protein